MRSPQFQAARNGETPSPSPPQQRHNHHHYNQTPFHSTLAVQKLRRFNWLIFIFRLAAFFFSCPSSVFMLTNSHGSSHWYDFDAFRFVFAANAIVALYSLFEMVVSVWEISWGLTIFPEALQVWFDFSHDQVFAYLLMSAQSAGTALARVLKEDQATCNTSSWFCMQADISIALGFAGFLFLGFSSLLSGFRVACLIINGSRFHL
ncbi:hypothetical protein CsatB_009570 [Cannabis sativa]|uniref:CASP-like protein n=1 Tax=Cannabis sativa TaxID=3483 RepID=A0A7J6EY86_CANSA|nr:CASP-like protein 4C1 [Cannabis sativa]KAF4363397.1 hypothetical protein F8388_016525 [Cannabis sativa]KAF4389223.1 hypothetical protein F8388_026952 [Cannabis sativa]